MRKTVPAKLQRLVELGKIKVNCLTGKRCSEGICDAEVSMKEGNLFHLKTGIVPGPDYLGSRAFYLSGVKKVIGNAVIIKTTEGDLMRLEPRK